MQRLSRQPQTACSRDRSRLVRWRDHPRATAERCQRVIVCTNGVRLPRSATRLRQWLLRLGEPATLKLSINHYLLEHDSGLIDLALLLREYQQQAADQFMLVLNVRLRKGQADDDASVEQQVASAGLLPYANVFYLQRYGFASEESGWEEPFVVGTDFRMLNPDGSLFGPDLLARSEGMRRLR